MRALIKTLADTQARTADLGGKGNTETFTNAIIANL
jgi:isocitrate/isopropylmalate dehydrogenase